MIKRQKEQVRKIRKLKEKGKENKILIEANEEFVKKYKPKKYEVDLRYARIVIKKTKESILKLIDGRIKELKEARRLFKKSNKKLIYPKENPIIEAKLTELEELKAKQY